MLIFRNRKFAFTLAEVLVTLGVIGVVAAMTIPTLNNHHRTAVQKAQYKAAYSLMSQALALAIEDLGYTPGCYYPYVWIDDVCVEYDDDGECSHYTLLDGSDFDGSKNGPTYGCPALFQKLQDTLKTIKYCDGNALSGGCIPEYEGNDTVAKSGNKNMTDREANMATTGCGGFRKNNILRTSKALVLSNGMIYIGYGENWEGFPKVFAIDINGIKGPNKWGYDLFNFRLVGSPNEEDIMIQPNGCDVVEPGGKSSQQMYDFAFGD